MNSSDLWRIFPDGSSFQRQTHTIRQRPLKGENLPHGNDRNAVLEPHRSPGTGSCAWERSGRKIPVEGWTAKPTRFRCHTKDGGLRTVKSFCVLQCPLFQNRLVLRRTDSRIRQEIRLYQKKRGQERNEQHLVQLARARQVRQARMART